MEALGDGYFGCERAGLAPRTPYGYQLDDGPALPDPASRAQPEGVEGRSALIDPERFRWTDRRWKGIARDRLIFYELHVGTFTMEGTFDGVRGALDRLRAMGVTMLELMPVAQFPGRRNWGYDGVFPFAVQHSYGGIAGLQRLSDACHARGLGLVLDVVVNHVGPEGGHLAQFGPYFTDRYHTPWGAALNFDGPGSDEVRRFFLESVTWLVAAAHLDGVRVDAVHAIVDPTAQPFLSELTQAVHELGRRTGWPRLLIAESELNDPRVAWPTPRGGLGFDALWNDDFHHALHVALTGERTGYFADFHGVDDLRQVLTEGFSLAGRFSRFRGRRHGRPAQDLEGEQLVVFAQNHDQVGNRPFGERLSQLIPFEAQKLAAGLTILAPFLPLLFMGSEYGETAPFLYFTDHRDPSLARAVREGRRREYASSTGGRDPPDPQARATFRRSVLTPLRNLTRPQRLLLEFHTALLALRRAFVRPGRPGPRDVGVSRRDPTVLWISRARRPRGPLTLSVFHFGEEPCSTYLPRVSRRIELRLASSAKRWGGPGSDAPLELLPDQDRPVTLPPWSFVFYAQRGVRRVP